MTITFKTRSTGAQEQTVVALAADRDFTIDDSQGSITDHFSDFDKDSIGFPGTEVAGAIALAPARSTVRLNGYIAGGVTRLGIKVRSVGDSQWQEAASLTFPDGEQSGVEFTIDEALEYQPTIRFNHAVGGSVEVRSQVLI